MYQQDLELSYLRAMINCEHDHTTELVYSHMRDRMNIIRMTIETMIPVQTTQTKPSPIRLLRSHTAQVRIAMMTRTIGTPQRTSINMSYDRTFRYDNTQDDQSCVDLSHAVPIIGGHVTTLTSTERVAPLTVFGWRSPQGICR